MNGAIEATRGPVRENIEAMAMAIIMALLLKYFIVEAYKIPTGSMQPTLIGDERSQIFDRILVDKLSYRLRDPERWEVAVFRYPLDHSKNFVKRVVGIGPEEFRVDFGDLWHRADSSEPWSILRRPRSVQDEAWKALQVEGEGDAWRPEALAGGWVFGERSIEADGEGRARFHPRDGDIRDDYLDGYPKALRDRIGTKVGGSGVNFVGDVRVDGTVAAEESVGLVFVEIQEGPTTYRLEIPGPAADAGAVPRIAGVGRPNRPAAPGAVTGAPYRLPAGRPVSFRAQNLDDLIELDVDGETVLALEIEPTRAQRAQVSIGLSGGGGRFEDLMVYRDIFYTPSKAGSRGITIPDGHYYVLGDNTQDSSDSREWTLARYSLPDGEEVRGNWRRGENPRSVGFGEPDGPYLKFDDEWGETHWLRQEEATQLGPEIAPFVPRAMIQGRAVAVFWPWKPSIGVFRLKWVN